MPSCQSKPRVCQARGKGVSRKPSRPSVLTSRTTPPSNHPSSLPEYDVPLRQTRTNRDISRAPSSPGNKSIKDYRGEAKMVFSGTIDGLRSGNYSCVIVLFVTWKGDDMNCIKEIEPLKQVFEEKFRFHTQSYQIPSKRSMQSLNKKLSDFVVDTPPGSLTIFYYGGHGYLGEETGKLKFAAKGTRYAKGDSSIFYQDILNSLKHLDGDLLLILDTCYAGGATYHHKLRRRIELLAATAHNRKTPGPEREGSFTPVLAEKLRLLLEDNPHGFLVSELFYALDYDDHVKIKPRWYMQSEMDYGRIFLSPQTQRPAESTEATLHLCLRIAEPPDTRVLHNIANSLRFTPHVKKISIGDLNAPEETIKELRKMINVAHMFRWWARRARKALKAKKGNSLEHEQSLAVHDWSQEASFKLGSGGEMVSVRIKGLFPSPKPEEPGAVQPPANQSVPRILLDGRDALSIDSVCTISNAPNPYYPLADGSDTMSNASSVYSNSFSLPSLAGEATPASSEGGINTRHLTEGLNHLASQREKKRKKNRRKRKRTEQVLETPNTRKKSYRVRMFIAVAVLLLVSLCINLAYQRGGTVSPRRVFQRQTMWGLGEWKPPFCLRVVTTKIKNGVR